MNTRPLLTIAIPTYNGAKTIRNMLDLLIPQLTNDIELVVSDNASTDDTKAIIKNYIDLGIKIRYIYNEFNIGPDANFLKCMLSGNGKYVWLLSDDDVPVENSLQSIINFLKVHNDVDLVYLTTRDFRGKYIRIDDCEIHKPEVQADLLTSDKKTFMKYAGYYWGFMSSFICKTENIIKISNPERFFGTFWLQSYIHALCCAGADSKMGVIKGPCVGAGIYVSVANLNTVKVNGYHYKQLLDFMIEEAGFDRSQLYGFYGRRLCHLLRHDVIKIKALGNRKINYTDIVLNTYKMHEAWLTVYPLFIIPGFLCKLIIGLYRKYKNITGNIDVNRA